MRKLGEIVGGTLLFGLLVVLAAASGCSYAFHALLGTNRTLRSLLLLTLIPSLVWAGVFEVKTEKIDQPVGTIDRVSLRTENSLTFEKGYIGSGIRQLIVSLGPLNYDSVGTMKRIDLIKQPAKTVGYQKQVNIGLSKFEYDSTGRLRYEKGICAFELIPAFKDVGIEFIFSTTQLKANYTLTEGSPTHLAWGLKDPQGIAQRKVLPIVAWDADGKPVEVITKWFADSLLADVGAGKLPITVDPSVIDSASTAASGILIGRPNPSTWLLSRDTINAQSATAGFNDNIIIAYDGTSGNDQTVRTALVFPMTALEQATTVDSVRLWLYTDGVQPSGDTAFSYVAKGTFTGATPAVGWFNDFVGWVAGSAHTFTPLDSTHIPFLVADGAGWKSTLLTRAGADTVKNHMGVDSLRLMLLEKHDVTWSIPTATVQYGIQSSTTTPPYLSIYYSTTSSTPAAVITLKDADTLKVTGARLSAVLGGKVDSLGGAGIDSIGFRYYKQGAAVGTALFTVLDSASASITWHASTAVDSFFVTTKAADSLTIDTLYVVTAFCSSGGSRVFSSVNDTISTYLTAGTVTTNADTLKYTLVKGTGTTTAVTSAVEPLIVTTPITARGVEWWYKGSLVTDTNLSAGAPFAVGAFSLFLDSLLVDTLVAFRIISTDIKGAHVGAVDTINTAGSGGGTVTVYDTTFIRRGGFGGRFSR